MDGNMSKIIGVVLALVIVIGGVVLVTSSDDEDTASSDAATTETTEAAEEAAPAAEAGSTIVDLAIATEDLSTLVAAVTAGELVDVLADPDAEFTVFAPTNDAFAALPEGTLDSLLLPENIEDLQGILTYHVVPSAALSTDLTDGMMLETVNGESLTVSISEDGVVSINDATVVTADVEASNGVVHIIDTVLLP